MNVRVIGLALLLLRGAAACADEAPPTDNERVTALDLVVMDEERLARLNLSIDLAGRPLAALWSDDHLFAPLVELCDRNDDGALDEAEARRLPSVFALRQALWAPVVPQSGAAPRWSDLDANEDGQVDPQELGVCYRRAGLGQPTVAFATSPASNALTVTLAACLDLNERNPSSASAPIEAFLRAFDANRDGLLQPSDLLPGTTYPGSHATQRLDPVQPARDRRVRILAPLMVLPALAADVEWGAALAALYDRNGDGRLAASEFIAGRPFFARLDVDADEQLTATEVSAWRRLPVDFPVQICFDPSLAAAEAAAASASVLIPGRRQQTSFDLPRTHLVLGADAGELPKLARSVCERYEYLFQQADKNQDACLDTEELAAKDVGDIKPIVEVVDRNGDGQLARCELDAWCSFQERLTQAQVLVTVLDHGPGLFEFLDTDRNGALSPRELSVARQRLEDSGLINKGVCEVARLPRQVSIVVSQGHPQYPLPRARHAGAPWFQAMDRNGDGDLARQEFLGPVADFRRADRDGNQLVDWQEAAALLSFGDPSAARNGAAAQPRGAAQPVDGCERASGLGP